MLSRLIGLLAGLLALAGAVAAPPVVHDFAVLEDRAGSETIETVATAEPSRFRQLRALQFAGGYTRSVHWFRLVVDAPAGESWLEVVPPLLDDLRLYQPVPGRPGQFSVRRQGDAQPFAQREVQTRTNVFKLDRAGPGRYTLYLRVQTSSSSMVTLRLWEPPEFEDKARLEYGLYMAALAIVLTMLLINVNAWFWLREQFSAWYVAYLLLVAGLFAGNAGFLHQYVYPASASANQWVIGAMSVAFVAVGNGFYRRLLMVERSQPLVYGAFELMFWGPLLALPAAVAGWYPEVMRVLTGAQLPMTLVGSVLAVRLRRRGAPGADMMLVANLIGLSSALAFVLYLQGAPVGDLINSFALWLASLGSLLALQMAVGARHRAVHDARLRAEGDAEREREMRVQQGQFLSMLAHELRTSLSVLKMAIGRQPMSQKALGSAERAITAMGDVIERSIQAEKLADGSVALERQPCDVAGLLEAVVADSAGAERFGLHFAVRPDIHTDAKLLRVVLSNLVDNAAKYAVAGSRIDVEIVRAEPVVLTVSNRIEAAGAPDPQRVFDKFYRGPSAHRQTGSGLGLHIARGIAQRLGGSLTCRIDDLTVCFRLTLPTGR